MRINIRYYLFFLLFVGTLLGCTSQEPIDQTKKKVAPISLTVSQNTTRLQYTWTNAKVLQTIWSKGDAFEVYTKDATQVNTPFVYDMKNTTGGNIQFTSSSSMLHEGDAFVACYPSGIEGGEIKKGTLTPQSVELTGMNTSIKDLMVGHGVFSKKSTEALQFHHLLSAIRINLKTLKKSTVTKIVLSGEGVYQSYTAELSSKDAKLTDLKKGEINVTVPNYAPEMTKTWQIFMLPTTVSQLICQFETADGYYEYILETPVILDAGKISEITIDPMALTFKPNSTKFINELTEKKMLHATLRGVKHSASNNGKNCEPFIAYYNIDVVSKKIQWMYFNSNNVLQNIEKSYTIKDATLTWKGALEINDKLHVEGIKLDNYGQFSIKGKRPNGVHLLSNEYAGEQFKENQSGFELWPRDNDTENYHPAQETGMSADLMKLFTAYASDRWYWLEMQKCNHLGAHKEDHTIKNLGLIHSLPNNVNYWITLKIKNGYPNKDIVVFDLIANSNEEARVYNEEHLALLYTTIAQEQGWIVVWHEDEDAIGNGHTWFCLLDKNGKHWMKFHWM